MLAQVATNPVRPGRSEVVQRGPVALVEPGGVDRCHQQVTQLVPGVGYGVVGAGERALHAGGARGSVEDRQGAAEDALVLGRSGADRHEQARAGHDRCVVEGALTQRPPEDLLEVARVEQSAVALLGHRRRHRDRQGCPHVREDRIGLDGCEGRVGVVDADGPHAVADHGDIGLDDAFAAAPELLGELGPHLGLDLLRCASADCAVHVADDRADEGDAHHAGLQLRVGSVRAGNSESVEHEEPDAAFGDGAPCEGRQFPPDVDGLTVGLHDQRAAGHKALQRVGVGEHLVVGCHDDLDVLEFGVGDQHRLGGEGDVVIRRGAGLLRAVLGRRLRVHAHQRAQQVGEQLAGRDRAVTTDGVEADAQRTGWENLGVLLRDERHGLGLRVRGAELLLDGGDGRGRAVGEELRAQVHQWRTVAGRHVPHGCDEVAGLDVVAAEAEDRGRHPRDRAERGDLRIRQPAGGIGVGAGMEQCLRDEPHEGCVVGPLEDGDGAGSPDRLHELRLGERLQQLHGDHAHGKAEACEVGEQCLGVVGDRAHADQDKLGVCRSVGLHGRVRPSAECCVLGHRLTDKGRNGAGEVGAVVGRTGLEVGLVLHRAGEAGVVRVDERRDQLPGSLRRGVQPLPAPLRTQVLGNPGEGRGDQVTGVVHFRSVAQGSEVRSERSEVAGSEVVGVPVEETLELEHPALGAEEHLLRNGRRRDAPLGVAEVGAQQFGLRQEDFAHHVAGGEAVHGIRDRHQRER